MTRKRMLALRCGPAPVAGGILVTRGAEEPKWKIYGMALPPDVLEKVYHANAEKVFSQLKGLAAGK